VNSGTISKSKAGVALFLLLFSLSFLNPAFAAAPDMFSPPDNVGASKIPRFGNARIPVLILSGNKAVAESSARRPFFSNDLAANTFRNYWSVNSVSVYDPHIVPLISNIGKISIPESGAADKKKWISLIAQTLAGLAEQGVFEPAAYDINGQTNMPDGRMDGIIVLVEGLHEVFRISPDDKDDTAVGGVRLGPALIAGVSTSDYELLRGFAGLIGFADMSPLPDSRGGICLSLTGRPTNSPEAGFPLLDGYSRLRAGWARPVKFVGLPRKVFILPARTSGEVYTIGGDSEFFVIENRSAGGGYDSQIEKPGLAIYHIDESKTGADVWQPAIMNVGPDGAFHLQLGDLVKPDRLLFRDGDSLDSDYSFQNPLSEKLHQLNSNWYSGEPSDITVKDIDSKTHLPIISATIGFD
jgi:hypothetical protein